MEINLEHQVWHQICFVAVPSLYCLFIWLPTVSLFRRETMRSCQKTEPFADPLKTSLPVRGSTRPVFWGSSYSQLWSQRSAPSLGNSGTRQGHRRPTGQSSGSLLPKDWISGQRIPVGADTLCRGKHTWKKAGKALIYKTNTLKKITVSLKRKKSISTLNAGRRPDWWLIDKAV